MANYLGDYHSDIGTVVKLVKLEVRYVNLETLRSEISDRAFDGQIIPSIFFDNVRDLSEDLGYCKNSFVPRKVLLWIGNADYLQVDLPFPGGSEKFSQFWELAENNPLIVQINSKGEVLKNSLLLDKYAS